MSKKRSFISILSVILGLPVVGAGVYFAITAIMTSPKEMGILIIIPFTVLGIFLTLWGVLFFVLGLKSWKGNEKAFDTIKFMLVFFQILIILITHYAIFQIVVSSSGDYNLLLGGYNQSLMSALWIVLIWGFVFSFFWYIDKRKKLKDISIDYVKKDKKEKLLLILFFILIIFVIIFLLMLKNAGEKSKQAEQTKLEQGQIVEELGEQSQKMKSDDILKNDDNGFELLIKTTGGLAGEYQLNFVIRYDGNIFVDMSKPLFLSSSSEQDITEISYDDLFEKCFTEFNRSRVYVCTEEGGTIGSEFEITVQLNLIEDNDGKINQLSEGYSLTSNIEKINFKIDTLADHERIYVSNFINLINQ